MPGRTYWGTRAGISETQPHPPTSISRLSTIVLVIITQGLLTPFSLHCDFSHRTSDLAYFSLCFYFCMAAVHLTTGPLFIFTSHRTDSSLTVLYTSYIFIFLHDEDLLLITSRCRTHLEPLYGNLLRYCGPSQTGECHKEIKWQDVSNTQ